ncbi:MAG TPA: hypothetical protein G4N99_09360 [Thermoflexia bacterium]|nr:hypothetical protein [Thermoflexia bacterium]
MPASGRAAGSQQFPFCSRDFQIASVFPRKAPCAIAKSRLRPDFSPITGIAGGFLADDHTLDNWKWAQWRPDLIDRNRYDRWVKLGRKDMFARANERAREILKEHETEPLPEEAEAVIAEVLAERAANQ